jgi:uncharacterized protein
MPEAMIMTMTWEQALLVIGAGILCGFVNTLAGSGSLISLPILMFIGLPPNLANGTNRVGVFVQNLVTSATFHRKQILDIPLGIQVAIPTIAGSILGAFLVLELPDRVVEIVVGVVLFVMLIPMWFSPKQWLEGKDLSNTKIRLWLRWLVFFLIGAYGGFIQAGVGIFLLAALVLNAGCNLVKANAQKAMINLVLTFFAMIVFALNGQIDWMVGLTLAFGNAIGGYLGTKWAVSWGPVFVRYVVMVVVVLAGVKLLFF